MNLSDPAGTCTDDDACPDEAAVEAEAVVPARVPCGRCFAYVEDATDMDQGPAADDVEEPFGA